MPYLANKYFTQTFLFISILSLTACQSVQLNSQLIAHAFNFATSYQQKRLDRFAPATVYVQQNIPYQQQPDLALDIYQPQFQQQSALRPTVVWLHGGGWLAGTKERARGYFKLLAAQGFNVVALEYQLAPQVVYPTQLNQIDQALRFLQRHAVNYQIDPQQFYLAGDSAGANLASHYAALVSNPNFAQQSQFKASIQPEQIKGLILHCGIYDLNAFIQTAPDQLKIIEWVVKNLLRAYTQHPKDNPQFLKRISPIQYLTPNYPPVFISGGNKDFLTKTQAIPFVEQLQKHQIPVEPVFYPDSKEWLIHEYQFMLSKQASQYTFYRSVDFIQRNSAPRSTARLVSFNVPAAETGSSSPVFTTENPEHQNTQ